jgi:hypothetical protein
MMIQFRDVSWWYWLASDVLLFLALAGRQEAYWLVCGLTLLQVCHFRLREGSFRAFPVQVRLAYGGILAFGAWPPTHGILWLPAIGTLAQVLFGYCLLARTLSLLPWNREAPLSPKLVRRTYLAPPTRGSILQGQPALQPGK